MGWRCRGDHEQIMASLVSRITTLAPGMPEDIVKKLAHFIRVRMIMIYSPQELHADIIDFLFQNRYESPNDELFYNIYSTMKGTYDAVPQLLLDVTDIIFIPTSLLRRRATLIMKEIQKDHKYLYDRRVD